MYELAYNDQLGSSINKRESLWKNGSRNKETKTYRIFFFWRCPKVAIARSCFRFCRDMYQCRWGNALANEERFRSPAKSKITCPGDTHMNSPSQLFGSHVLDLDTIKKRLPKTTYHALQAFVDEGREIGDEHADAIAHAIMEWSLEKGATHYCHWFQPMTGLTAQKHDAFLSFDANLKPIERFSGNQLIQGEPDASSFPSGGMRSTFEARGYTAWDPSSPVFIASFGDTPVLCIPSVFFSYTGHALDRKTPLLRSLKALNSAASTALELLTGRKAKVTSTVGFEQEYFLIDRELYHKRPDLIMASRSVLGTSPAKHQQMDDHYFGSIKDKVLKFMAEVENRLYKLGVPCKTRHNEVAPHQYEMAPIFQTANVAADHNQLVMETLQKVAAEYGLAAIVHEKPFAEVNGSGKHVNWSMATTDGTNLLEPGNNPHANLVFLYFLVAVVNAVHKRGALLRAAIATPGNDHRLGANEAPPAIMSVFLGAHLTEILNKIKESETLTAANVKEIDLGLAELPSIAQDPTDRNRTSPFAFTGNKFEFRAVGGSQSISEPISAINASVADSLNEMNAQLQKLENVDEASVLSMLRPFVTRSEPIRFEGNNYGDEWIEEAVKRGLPNLRTTPEALIHVYESEEYLKFFRDIGLYSTYEIESRYAVTLEHYNNVLGIEANILLRLLDNHVMPAAFRYQTEVATSVQAAQATAEDLGLEGLEAAVSHQAGVFSKLSTTIGHLIDARNRLEAAIEEAHTLESAKDEALHFATKVKELMVEARSHADSLEGQVDAELWTLPSYQEMLFVLN
jgi:glutamine synthetase